MRIFLVGLAAVSLWLGLVLAFWLLLGAAAVLQLGRFRARVREESELLDRIAANSGLPPEESATTVTVTVVT